MNFSMMYKEKIFTDIIFDFGDKKIHAHKSILAANSPVFRGMFNSEFIEAKGIVTINDIKADIFNDVLKDLYSGNVKYEKNIIDKILVADKYLMDILIKEYIQEYCDYAKKGTIFVQIDMLVDIDKSHSEINSLIKLRDELCTLIIPNLDYVRLTDSIYNLSEISVMTIFNKAYFKGNTHLRFVLERYKYSELPTWFEEKLKTCMNPDLLTCIGGVLSYSYSVYKLLYERGYYSDKEYIEKLECMIGHQIEEIPRKYCYEKYNFIERFRFHVNCVYKKNINSKNINSKNTFEFILNGGLYFNIKKIIIKNLPDNTHINDLYLYGYKNLIKSKIDDYTTNISNTTFIFNNNDWYNRLIITSEFKFKLNKGDIEIYGNLIK